MSDIPRCVHRFGYRLEDRRIMGVLVTVRVAGDRVCDRPARERKDGAWYCLRHLPLDEPVHEGLLPHTLVTLYDDWLAPEPVGAFESRQAR